MATAVVLLSLLFFLLAMATGQLEMACRSQYDNIDDLVTDFDNSFSPNNQLPESQRVSEKLIAGGGGGPGDVGGGPLGPLAAAAGAGGVAAEEPWSEQTDELALNVQRKSLIRWSQLVVYGSIVLSWFFGVLGFSIAWILLFTVLLHLVCSGRLTTLIEDCVSYEKRQLQRRSAVKSDETAEWLNFLFNRWWRNGSSSAFVWLKSTLDPLLKDAKPNMLESVTLKSLSLGAETPFISSIRSFDANGRKSEGVVGAHLMPGLVRYRLLMQAEVGIACPEFKMVFTGRYGGMEFDFQVENLFLTGKMQVVGHFGLDAPFPFIYKLSLKFIEKPKLDYEVTALRTPITKLGLKEMIQSQVMDTLTSNLVDPNELNIILSPNEALLPALQSGDTSAIGVIRVTIGWLHNQARASTCTSIKNDENRWCVLSLGSQSYTTCRSLPTTQWSDQHEFLIDSFSDRLFIKVKSKKMFGLNNTLVVFDDPIDFYLKNGQNFYNGTLIKNRIGLSIKMEFKSIISISKMIIEKGIDEPDCVNRERRVSSVSAGGGCVEGVLGVVIHGAEGLVNSNAKRLLNPYCVLFCNSKKIKTTHFENQTASPKWDSCIEFLVSDYTQADVTIAVCNWDSTKMADAGILGMARIKPLDNSSEQMMRNECVNLEHSEESFDGSNQKFYGQLSVTVVFQPTPFKNQTGFQERVSKDFQDEIYENNVQVNGFHENKCVLTNGIEEHNLITGLELMEVVILRAKNLIAKDLNGFSDPFCEIRINDEYYCKTTVKKRTLNPNWDEKLTIRLPRNGDTFSVVVWDDDTFGKDFLGSISFKIEDVRKLALEETSEWFVLKETKCGEIEMKFRIISESIDSCEMSDHSSGIANSAKSPVFDTFKSRPNFYGEDEPDAVPFTTSECNGHSPLPQQKLQPLSFIPDLPPKTKSQNHSPALSLPRTESSISRNNGSESPHESHRSVTSANLFNQNASVGGSSITPNTSKYDYVKNKASPSKVKSHVLTAVSIPVPPERKSSLPASVETRNLELGSPTTELEGIVEPTSPLARGSPAYSSFHEMKRKMKKTFSQPLRRFRSEACVHEDKSKNFKDRVIIETHDNVYSSCSNIEKLADELNVSPTADEISITKKTSEKPLRYYNIQGNVVQATGIDLPKESQMCCRVRLLPPSGKLSGGSKFSPKTIAKSKLIPYTPNPAFNLDFLLDLPNGVPPAFSLSFEIRKSNKETVANKSITLQELFEDAIEEGDEMRTCLSLNSGATLEVVLSHGKENGEQAKSKKSRLKRSWSIHRIGKI